MTPILAETCVVGHVAPAWTEAARAPESPTVGRCVVATAPPSSGRIWSLCGGFPLDGVVTPPGVCPVAPGGLAVKRETSRPGGRRWGEPDGAVTLDCPGRYEIREGTAGSVTVTLVDTAPSACAGVERGVLEGLVAGWPQVDPTGLALQPVTALPPDVRSLLPSALGTASVADLVDGGGPLSATLVWRTGPILLPIAGFDLQVGRSAAWQAVELRGDSGSVSLGLAPVRFSTSLVDSAGARVEVATWASMGWSSTTSWLDDVVPVRLPESTACGARVAAGTPAGVQSGELPTSQRTCRAPPTTPPDRVTLGPGWVLLDWDDVPAGLRRASTPTSRNADPDPGCDLACR